MSGTIEHRRHPRVPADLSLRLGADSCCRVKDISASGVRCVCPIHLSPMTVVGVRLEVPVHLNGEDLWREVNCQGVVVRCRPLPADAEQGFEVAIFFQGLSDADELTLASYVEGHL